MKKASIPPAAHLTRPAKLLVPGNALLVSPLILLTYLNPLRSANANTLSQSLWTSCSASCLHVIKFSIHPSRIGIDAGSVVGDNLVGEGTRPTSSIFVSIVLFILCDGFDGLLLT